MNGYHTTLLRLARLTVVLALVLGLVELNTRINDEQMVG
jgi:hypothetical protein